MTDPATRAAGAVYVDEVRLRQSRAPHAELGAAGLRALERAGIADGKADVIVIAVEAGRADGLVAGLERVARGE